MEENKELDSNPLDNQISIGEERAKTISHKDEALNRLDISFNKHIELSEYKKSNLIAYWIKDFSNYHDQERTFKPNKLITFKRGNIVKVNLGFNIGNELGGLHYCVVINKNDNPYAGTLNVIPLSSAKSDKVYNKSTCVDLSDEIYTLLNNKFMKGFLTVKEEIATLDSLDEEKQHLKVTEISKKINYFEKMKVELRRMKHGSVALVHQITTISKIRVFNTTDNILSGLKISDASLNAIDNKLLELFTK